MKHLLGTPISKELS